VVAYRKFNTSLTLADQGIWLAAKSMIISSLLQIRRNYNKNKTQQNVKMRQYNHIRDTVEEKKTAAITELA
jgi:hypothetical protein